ncbi:MAG TPA: SH3 domain-containing C40 family peptidase [Gemmatimonadaceae bacterium]|nr:SH3 domain-containing C40 family peptidase [Gemmatimonadaceae bacterium]
MATETHVTEPDAPILFEATVRTPVAPMHSEPRIASMMISQQLAGHRVDVLDEEGDWVRARGADGYDGWMHTGFLARAPRNTTRQSRQATRISLGCTTYTASGDRRALPLRALLAPDESVKSGDVVEAVRAAERFPLDPIAITRSAQELFAGTSYLWGGVTPWGADCSGLVQSVYALHGMQLPRDAWQQAELGTDAGRDIGELKPADLLFFSDRPDQRITHVGIALGERRMVHLALGRGGFCVERLDNRADAYVDRLRERFLFARRFL